MNATINDILTRRSVRTFQRRQIDRDILSTVLEAGLSAPSAHGKRPVRLAVLEDESVRKRIASVMTWFQPVVKAPAAILVLGDPTVCTQRDYWVVDCAASTENILVAARSLSLGTVWCGISPVADNVEAIRSVLDIPAPLVPFAAIAIGYPVKDDVFKEVTLDTSKYVYWNPAWDKQAK